MGLFHVMLLDGYAAALFGDADSDSADGEDAVSAGGVIDGPLYPNFQVTADGNGLAGAKQQAIDTQVDGLAATPERTPAGNAFVMEIEGNGVPRGGAALKLDPIPPLQLGVSRLFSDGKGALNVGMMGPLLCKILAKLQIAADLPVLRTAEFRPKGRKPRAADRGIEAPAFLGRGYKLSHA